MRCMMKSKNVVLDVAKDFEKMSGRKYGFLSHTGSKMPT